MVKIRGNRVAVDRPGCGPQWPIGAFNAEMRNLATSAKREPLAAKRTLAEIERSSPHRARHRGRRPHPHPEGPSHRAGAGEGANGNALRAGKRAPVLQLHTNLPELDRSKIGRLAEALNAPETVTKAAEVMRGLIDRIVLTPVAGELRTELHGDLAVLARCAQEGERRSAGNPARISVVAGERNPLYRTLFTYPF
jgi:hypothetical protein